MLQGVFYRQFYKEPYYCPWQCHHYKDFREALRIWRDLYNMDTLGLKGVTIFEILCLFYGVLLGFYVGICKQCNYGYLKQQGVQYTTQDKGIIMRQTSNSVVQPIKYDRSELLSWAKYRKLSGFSNEDIKRIKLLNLKQSFFRTKEERKEQNGNSTEVFIMNYCMPYQKRK